MPGGVWTKSRQHGPPAASTVDTTAAAVVALAPLEPLAPTRARGVKRGQDSPPATARRTSHGPTAALEASASTVLDDVAADKAGGAHT